MTRPGQSSVWMAVAFLAATGWLNSRAESQSSIANQNGGAAAAYREGQAALSRNDLAAARKAFEQVVALSPRTEEGHVALGQILLQQGEAPAAVRELQAARAISSTDPNAEINLALAYQQMGLSTKAIPLFADFSSGAQLRKQVVPAFVRAAYARAFAATGKLSQATMEMEAAVKAEARNAGLRSDLGALYAQQKKWSQAEQEFRDVVALDPKSGEAHLRLGLAMQAQQEPGAIAELARAAELAPDNATAQLEQGKALAAAGEDGQAIPILERVHTSQPNSIEATDQLALAYQRTNRIPEAIALFHKVLAERPEDATVLTNLGMALAQAQQAKDAVPLLQHAVALAPQSVIAHQDLAAAYVQLSRFSDAAAELRMALRLDPDSPALHYNLGFALKSGDDAAGAISELEQAEKLDPAGPEAPYLLGVLDMQAGRYADASRELQTTLRLRPENGEGWATLGSVYSKLEQLPEAVTALRESIKQMPEQPDAHLTLAVVLAKQNQPAEAAAERKQAATLMRSHMNRQRAEVATGSGKSLLKSGDLAGAAQQFQDAISYDAAYAEAHLGLASVYDAQGKSGEAASEREKAVSGSSHP